MTVSAQPTAPADGLLQSRGQPMPRPRSHPQVQLDGYLLFGIGGQSFLGTQLHVTAAWRHWATRRAFGTWDLGAQLAYHNEPVFLAPWIDPSQVEGATHRVQATITAGHTVHMGPRRLWSLGIHLYGGLNHWRSDYSVEYAAEGVSGSAVMTRNHFVLGGQLEVGYRFHRFVGIGVVLGGPFPTGSSYVSSMFHVGLGLTFHLH